MACCDPKPHDQRDAPPLHAPAARTGSERAEGPLNSGDVTGLEGLAKLALVPLIADAPRPPVGPALPRAPRFGPPGAASAEQ
eukprot:3302524-Prymnesium_polylepis.1